MRPLPRIITMAISMIAGFFLLYWMYEQQQPTQKTGVAIMQDKSNDSTFPPVGGSFELIDQKGQIRKDTDFRGKIMMVYFGYTFCPDICPTGLYSMTQALNSLKPRQQAQIQPLFITVDPERDTPKTLEPYMTNFHSQFLALTGTTEQIEDLKKKYHVYAAKAEPDGITTEYIMDHSSIVYIMDREGRFIAHFNHGTEPEQMAEILRKALN